MKIYTKTGDKGTTALLDRSRVTKNHPRVDLYGDVDELNSIIGIVISYRLEKDLNNQLATIQKNLMSLSSILANPKYKRSKGKLDVSEEHVHELEQNIDEIEKELPPLTNFILPGGAKVASFLHLARTVCRRAERKCAALANNDTLDPICLIYLNRLSDYLYIAARYANFLRRYKDIVW